jgi:putative spermidine/putrescine transport system substrate-binding protein
MDKKLPMLSRRSFLRGAGTTALAASLSGCGETKGGLQVRLLKGSIPPQITGQFRQQVGRSPSLSFKPEAQLKDLFSLLENWQKKTSNKQNLPNWLPLGQQPSQNPANLVTLGDAWLERAIRAKLLQPLNGEGLTGWPQLPERWQQLVRRNERGEPDAKGAIWGAPYRWGTLLIAYRRDKFQELGWTPSDWGDLWREDLRERLSVINQPRAIIGLTLKKLGYSYNTPDLQKIPELKGSLFSLAKQIKFYSSQYYLQPLVLGDTWLAVGWSGDILSLVNRNPQIAAVVPQSGTSLWTDLWVKPAGSGADPLGNRWIDFCWQRSVAKQITAFADAASPILLNLPAADIPQNIRDNPLLLVKREIVAKSDFLLPLLPAASQQYDDLWRQMRTVSPKVAAIK